VQEFIIVESHADVRGDAPLPGQIGQYQGAKENTSRPSASPEAFWQRFSRPHIFPRTSPAAFDLPRPYIEQASE
jgi:hypothetical protein